MIWRVLYFTERDFDIILYGQTAKQIGNNMIKSVTRGKEPQATEHDISCGRDDHRRHRRSYATYMAAGGALRGG